MKLSLFDYNLPKSLIAQKPASPRDSSKLLVYNKKTDQIVHDHFFNLPKYLQKGDILVFNNSKEIPARLLGQKPTGGHAEAVLLKELGNQEWEAIIGTRKPKKGLKLSFQQNLEALLVKQLSNKTWQIRFNFGPNKFKAILAKIGQMPLPPYITEYDTKDTKQNKKLKQQYQTIYAKCEGSAAAPTAGLHFTKRLMNKLKNKGIQFEYITLHVGLGTFEPVNTENIKDFKIHSEQISVDKKTIERLIKAKKQGRRIIAVGTTSVRTLESLFNKYKAKNTNYSSLTNHHSPLTTHHSLLTNIFIYPGYKFKFVDAMITNFHLPKSSLLMLIAAFIGTDKTLTIYKKAVKLKYRFFSFGDGMLLE